MTVMWNALMNMPNAGEGFANSFNQGIKNRQTAQDDAEDRQLRRQQIMAQQLRQQHEDGLAAVSQHRDNIIAGAQIIRQINPTDQPSWDQVRALATQAGVDVSEVPQQFDPQYVKSVTALADAFKPEKQTQDRIVTPQPGGGVGLLSDTGDYHWVVQPNDGSHAAGAPVNGGQPLTDEQMRAMMGGQSGAAPAGNFR